MKPFKFLKPISHEERLVKRLRGQPVSRTHPELIEKEWNYSKNFFGPDYFGPGSSQAVFWTCSNGHTFKSPICYRTRAVNSKSGGCSVCSGRKPVKAPSLIAAYPDIAQEWLAKENGCSVRYIASNSKRLGYFCCSRCGHVFRTRVSARTNKDMPQGCPLCYRRSGAATISLADFPKLLSLYDRTSANFGFNVFALPVDHKLSWRCQHDDEHGVYESVRDFTKHDLCCRRCRLAPTAETVLASNKITTVRLSADRQALSTQKQSTKREKRSKGNLGQKFASLFLAAVLAAAFWIVGCTGAGAQAVSWTDVDLGSPGASGSLTYTAGTPPTFTIQGAGTGLGSPNDNLTFVNVATSGNIEIEAQVVSQSSTGSGALAGLMMRDSLDDFGAVAVIGVTKSNGVYFYYRQRDGSLTTVTGPAVSAPVYLRLARNGNSITGYESSDGVTWSSVGTFTLTGVMPSVFYVGMTVASSSSGVLNTSVFEDVVYMTSLPQPSANLVQWLRSDVGVTYSGGTVSGWADQSGNGNNASQSTSGIQPSFTTGVINSGVLPAVVFNGSSNYMSMASGFGDFTAGASIFVLCEPASSIATGDLCSFSNSSNADALIAQTQGTQASLSAYNNTTSSSVTTTSNPLTTGQYQLVEEIFQPGATNGTGTIFVNGSQKIQSTSLVNTLRNVTRADNYIGTGAGLSDYFDGGIAEVLVFNTALNSSQRASIESYMLSKTGIGTQPTLDAPTFSPQSGAVLTPRQNVVPSQDQNGACYFTQDGSTPAVGSSQWYNGVGISVPYPMTIKSLGVAPFFNNSSVATASYQVDATTLPVSRDGLVLWLNASNSVSTSGSNVTQWGDISGSGNTATQSTSGDRPTLVSNAVNGFSAVSFNGSSDFMQLPAGMADFTAGESLFVVLNPTSVTSGARILDFGNGSASDNLLLEEPTSSGAELSTYNGSSGTSVTSSSALTTGQFHLLEVVNNGSGTATIYTDGVQGAQSTSMNALNNLLRNNNYIGQASAGGNYFDGEIAEVLCYNRPVSVSERTALESFLLNKYQVLPAANVPAPTIGPAGGTYSAPLQVGIAGLSDAQIFFTSDGTTPTTSSTPFSGPINVTYTQTIKAIAVIGGVSSTVSSATYTLNSTQYPAPSSGSNPPLQFNTNFPPSANPNN